MFAVPCRIDRRRSRSCKGVSPANSQRAFLWVRFMAGGSRLIFGVGINDSTYSTRRAVKSNGSQKTLWECPFYSKWKSMLERCYSKRWLELRPSYIGSSVCEEWLTFSKFASWMALQDYEGKDLEKDLLIPGNKVYAPDRCIFVSEKLNVFIVDSGFNRRSHRIGVYFHKTKKKFIAQVNNPFTGKRQHLGVFSSVDSAHEAWRSAKHSLACRYADMQDDPRIAEALRSRYLPSKEHK